VSSNVQDSAAREAIEAERSVAARKRTESGASKSKEALASIDRKGSPTKVGKPTSKKSFDFEESNVDSAELALRPSTKARKSKAASVDSELETAEWSGDSLDRSVKTVSGEREADDVEIAEPLLETRGREAVASELFDEQESLSAKKPALKQKSIEKITASTTGKPRPKAASVESSSEHPWASNSLAESQTRVGKAKTATKTASTNKGLVAEDGDERANASLQRKPSKTSRADQSTLDEAQQLEAKARVEALLTQSKSLVRRGEFRSAYRVAQLAQRVADSEELFFTAGEVQPADVVRSVLMKIRFEESQLADASELESEREESAEVVKEPASPWDTPASKVVSRPATAHSNLPGGWSSADSHGSATQWADDSDSSASSHSPWTRGEVITTAPHSIRIKPGSVARTSRINPAFPMRKEEWRSSANEPLSLSSALGSEDKSLTTTTPNVESPEVVQVNRQSDLIEDLPAQTASAETIDGLVPLPFPKNPAGELQASAEEWRTQDINNFETNRSPLLVAPLPPEEPAMGPTLPEEVMDGTLAIDIQEQTQPPQESKLWMMLAAAAGAFAMLFVRRRPAAVVRSGGAGR